MNMRTSRIIDIAAIALAALVGGCTAEPFDTESGISFRPVRQGQVAFTANLACGPATKSDYDTYPVESPTGETVEIEAFLRPMSGGPMGGDPETKAAPVDAMYTSFSFAAFPYGPKTAVLNAEGLYAVSGMRFSDLEEGTSFLCWAPVGAEGVSYDPATRHIIYEMPSDVTRQADLVVATSGTVLPDNEDPVDLTFRHALAGIQVKAADIFPSCTVKSVTLKNVYGKGEYDPETGTWTVDPESITDLELLPAEKSGVTAGAGICDGDYTAMLIPQVLPSEATLSITLKYNSVDFSYGFSIGAKRILAGVVLEAGLDCRSMYLFEGTATGEFYFRQNFTVLCTITPDEDGSFSVCLPTGNLQYDHTLGAPNYQYASSAGWRNASLTTVTRVPDFFELKKTFANMFCGCTALESVCDIKSLSATTFNRTFYKCWKLKSVGSICTSKATSFNHMFAECSSLEENPSMDTSAGKDFNGMFEYASRLKKVNLINTGNATDVGYMFRGCTALADVPLLDLSKATNLFYFMADCRALQALPLFDLSAAVDMSYSFSGMYKLEEIPAFDLSHVTKLYRTFDTCTSLVSLPDFDFSNAVNLNGMFEGCNKLKSAPSYSFPKATDIGFFFYNCTKLETIGEMSIPEVTNLSATFRQCEKLREIPLKSIPKVSNMHECFNRCLSIKSIPSFDFSSVKNMGWAFAGCSSLVEIPDINAPQCTIYTYFLDTCTSLSKLGVVDASGITASFLYSSSSHPTRLTDFGGFRGLKYSITLSRMSNLSRESLLNCLDGLADTEDGTITFSSSQRGLLSDEDLAPAIAKGWTIE